MLCCPTKLGRGLPDDIMGVALSEPQKGCEKAILSEKACTVTGKRLNWGHSMCLYPNCLAQRDLCIGRCDVCLAENSRKYLRPLIQCDHFSSENVRLAHQIHPSREDGCVADSKDTQTYPKIFCPQKITWCSSSTILHKGILFIGSFIEIYNPLQQIWSITQQLRATGLVML